MKYQEQYFKAGVIHGNECEVCRDLKRIARRSFVRRSEGVFWGLVAILALSYMIVGYWL